MKKILLAAVLALATLTLQAASFSATSTDVGVTNSFIAVPVGPGTPVVNYVNVTSDKAGSLLKFYSSGDTVTITTNVAAGVNEISIPGTGKFNTNDIVLIRIPSTSVYQLTTVAVVAEQTITVTTNALALAAGNTVYVQTLTGSFPVGSNTVTIAAPFWSGTAGMPLVMAIDSTSAGQINAAFVRYE